MIEFNHGLVIGKFYPPHAGHHFLIRTAARHCRQVTVVVMPSSGENIAMELRLQWLRAVFSDFPQILFSGIVDDIPVDYHNASIWEAHVGLMRQAVTTSDQQRGSVFPIDAVFSSENYGVELARHFDAAPVCLDQARAVYPVSGTRVRQNPATCWNFLAPEVQEWLSVRIIIVGAESTGKTTLAQNLAEYFRQHIPGFQNTEWVAEYGREYSWVKLAMAKAKLQPNAWKPDLGDLKWESAEFMDIAREQQDRENRKARLSGPLLVADTDAFTTGIWHERYTGQRSSDVESVMSGIHLSRLYLLTDVHSVPFEQDGIRDGEHIREWMQERFKARLQDEGYQWRPVQGNASSCLAQAVLAVQEYLNETWNFTPPLG